VNAITNVLLSKYCFWDNKFTDQRLITQNLYRLRNSYDYKPSRRKFLPGLIMTLQNINSKTKEENFNGYVEIISTTCGKDKNIFVVSFWLTSK